jgi:hypothetical protein
MAREELQVNGVSIDAVTDGARGEVRTVTLPSGKTAAVRKGVGRDLMRAQRAAGAAADSSAIVFALIAELTRVDGSRIVYEDVLAMDINDVLALQKEVAGANFQLPPRAPSPPSSTSDSK